jgi:hypothetical protein
MDITFEQLKAFQATAERLSFSKAAEQIFRTQSAVSIQIAKLEDTVRQKLFQRTCPSGRAAQWVDAAIFFRRQGFGDRSVREQPARNVSAARRGPGWSDISRPRFLMNRVGCATDRYAFSGALMGLPEFVR